MQTFHGTRSYAAAASDALRGTGDLTDGQIHRTGFLAGAAGDARFLFPVDLHPAEAVEPAVDGAQGAEVLAEGAVDLYGKQQDQQQDSELPEEKSSDLASKQPIGREQGQRAQKGAGGAQIFAERRNFGKAAEQKQGTDTYKKYKDCVFSVF